MSISKQMTIFCDGCGCAKWEQITCSKATIIRKYVKKKGWTHRRHGSVWEDFCEDCSRELLPEDLSRKINTKKKPDVVIETDMTKEEFEAMEINLL
jgi:hypothetical protein